MDVWVLGVGNNRVCKMEFVRISEMPASIAVTCHVLGATDIPFDSYCDNRILLWARVLLRTCS